MTFFQNAKVLPMAKYRKWLAYVLFAAVASGVFLYICFPSEAVQQYLEGSATGFDPSLALRVDRIRLAFPFGLKLESPDLGLKESPGISLFKADSFVLMPSIRTLTLRRPALGFDCRAYAGKIQGVIALEKFSLEGPFDSHIEITGVRLGQYPLLREWLKRDLTGTMSGIMTYVCSRGNYLQGSGNGDFSILDGSVRFAQPFLGVESLDFHRIDARIVIEKQEISLPRLEFKGKQMEGMVSGTIHLNPNFQKSTLNLKLAVKPLADFLADEENFFDAAQFLTQRLTSGNFTIVIRGTVARPRINFI
jgi:type II secretion system protein N